MSVTTFGITATSVRAHHFPHLNEFSTTSNPTATTVGDMVNESAGELEGKLLKESIVAADITSGTAAYYWCAQTLRMMAAIKAARAMTAQDPAVVQAWQKQLDARFEDLDENGGTALGNDNLSTEASDPDGPTDHIDEYSLDIGDPTTDASDVVPVLRRGDAL